METYWKQCKKKMIKIFDVKEAVIIRDALTMMLEKLARDENLYKDIKLYKQTLIAVNSLRIKYHKIALTQMRKNEVGEFEFKNAN